MRNYLIIHGHFYQPPREDPWTGVVPYQESAYPHHDWNKRITKECYAANSASRTLDPQGRITSILNNYEYLSFNFGPTLMQWLKREAPNVYERIVEADKTSRERRRGHGNALAQGYNHTILPLDSPEDLTTQVVWGMEDFQSHFNRDPEGIWLPEAAVNLPVVDELIRQGIRFIVLSPWQGQAYAREGQNRWKQLHGHPMPSDRAYRIERPGGSLGVFFYNHTLASGISFEHFLLNADSLYDRFKVHKHEDSPSHLINTATDGEIYGHHEPYGDMCLAAFSRLTAEREDFEWTNYGEYLELNPPKTLVQLRSGEEERGSSWSCYHGVSRWYKDCGCSTGGQENWNQQWRAPLREAFQRLSEKLREIYFERMSELSSTDPAEIRNRYSQVLTGKDSPEEFAKAYLDRTQPKATRITQFLELLEGQKFCLYSFTSCGWFFSEISGIEPTQNMKYALKAIRFYQDYTEEDLYEVLREPLSRAVSNLPDKGTGDQILQSMIIPDEKHTDFAASVFIIQALTQGGFDPKKPFLFGDYRCQALKGTLKETPSPQKDDWAPKTYEGEVILTHLPTCRTQTYAFTFHEGSETAKAAIDLKEKGTKASHSVPLGTLPFEVRSALTHHIFRPLEKLCRKESLLSLPRLKHILSYTEKISLSLPLDIQRLAEMSINCALEGILNRKEDLTTEETGEAASLLRLARRYKLNIDADTFKEKLSQMIARQVEALRQDLTHQGIQYIFDILEAARAGGIEPETTHSQNMIYFLIRESAEECFQDIAQEDFQGIKKIKYLIRMGEIFGINVDDIKRRFLEI